MDSLPSGCMTVSSPVTFTADGDTVAAHELGEGAVSDKPLARVAVDEALVDSPLGDAEQLGLRPDLLDVGLEGSPPLPVGVARVAPSSRRQPCTGPCRTSWLCR